MCKLSIVALVYNLEEYLPRCLDSLVNQTLDDVEILCVDDGSTDSAPKIIDEYAKKYPQKVKAFHKENGGEFTTRNYGLERATGEYITFVDTDDYVEPTWAEKLYNAAKENEADIAVCGFERIDLDSGKVVGKDMIGFNQEAKNIDPTDDFMVFINPAPWNKIYRREKIKDLRFLPFRGFNDMLFLASSFTKIEKVAFVPEVQYHYFLRGTSQIHSVNVQDVENLKKYFLEVKTLYEKEKKYEELKDILSLMAFIHLAVSVMYRVSYDKSVKMKNMMKETIKYLDESFEGWRNNRFLTLRYSIKKGFKHIGLWGISTLYKIGLPMLFIRVYRFVIDKCKIDIKW